MLKSNQIPSRVINFNVYDDEKDNRLIGVATVDLPEPERMSEEITGAGIAGTVDMPLPGHFESMTTTITWNVPTKETFRLFSGANSHPVTMRASIQVYDAGTGKYKTVPLKVSMSIISKSLSLGTLEPNAKMDTGKEFSVVRIKSWLDGKKVVEIDPLNFICEIDGKDELASVRRDLGML